MKPLCAIPQCLEVRNTIFGDHYFHGLVANFNLALSIFFTDATRLSIKFANKAIRLTDDYSSRTIAANTAISVCLAVAVLTGLFLWTLAVKKVRSEI